MTNTIAVDETAKGKDVERKTKSQQRKQKNFCERVRLRVKVGNSHGISEGESWISRWCYLHCQQLIKPIYQKAQWNSELGDCPLRVAVCCTLFGHFLPAENHIAL